MGSAEHGVLRKRCLPGAGPGTGDAVLNKTEETSVLLAHPSGGKTNTQVSQGKGNCCFGEVMQVGRLMAGHRLCTQMFVPAWAGLRPISCTFPLCFAFQMNGWVHTEKTGEYRISA